MATGLGKLWIQTCCHPLEILALSLGFKIYQLYLIWGRIRPPPTPTTIITTTNPQPQSSLKNWFLTNQSSEIYRRAYVRQTVDKSAATRVSNQQIITIIITRKIITIGKTIVFTPGKTNIFCYICNKNGHKAFQCQNKRRKDFCQNIKIIQKTKPISLLPDMILFQIKVICWLTAGATEHVINDKSKFINFDQNFEPGNHFVKLANVSRANDIVLKRRNACIYSLNSKGLICRCILKNALYIPTFKQNIFSIQAATKNGVLISFERDNLQLI